MPVMIINHGSTGVQEYHIDGFRFDLASILTRAPSAFHPADWVTAMASAATTPVRPGEKVRTPAPLLTLEYLHATYKSPTLIYRGKAHDVNPSALNAV